MPIFLAAEHESRSRLAIARDQIARMEQLEDEQRSAALTVRQHEQREFEEELKTERELSTCEVAAASGNLSKL